jgi:hypothetical protein
MTFKNMKIEITDEAHLKAVCERLDAMGYKKELWCAHWHTVMIATNEGGIYSNFDDHPCDFPDYEIVLIDDLKVCAVDNIRDIRNHLSPHTVVIDL